VRCVGAAYQISRHAVSYTHAKRALVIGVVAALFVVFLAISKERLSLLTATRWLAQLLEVADIKDINEPADAPTGGGELRFYWWWRASRVIHDKTLQGGDQEVIDEFPVL